MNLTFVELVEDRMEVVNRVIGFSDFPDFVEDSRLGKVESDYFFKPCKHHKSSLNLPCSKIDDKVLEKKRYFGCLEKDQFY